MNEGLPISDFDVFYISYDEPLCESYWADLRLHAPWAKRVHGVKGFDKAHKSCAEWSRTDRFITVDGDNLVDDSFFWEQLVIMTQHKDFVFSWGGNNVVNGLIYGNGGLKCWTRETVMAMRSHEAAVNDTSKVDFCWDLSYVQMRNSYSKVYPNGTPYQAFRAGFREGVKMSLDRGRRVEPYRLTTKLWKGNIDRLRIWCSVGADVPNGLWCIYGARLGAYMTNLTDWDFASIADYDWFKSFWETEIVPKFAGREETCDISCYRWSRTKLIAEIESLGKDIRAGLNLPITLYNSEASSFFKSTYINPERTGVLTPEEA